jgi:hypothetical protein
MIDRISGGVSEFLASLNAYDALGPLSWFCTLLALVLMAAPLLRYVALGWWLKMKLVTNQFDPEAIELYFRKYRTSERAANKKQLLAELQFPKDRKRLTEEFLTLYCREFGRRRYFLALAILLIVTLVETIAVVQTGLFQIRSHMVAIKHCGGPDLVAACTAKPEYQTALAELSDHLVSNTLLLDATTVAGLVGAYMWVVQDAIRRMRSGDLLPSDVYWSALRMLIAAPLGLAISSLVPQQGGFVAFGIGAFPIEQISRLIRTLTAKLLGVTDDPDTDGDEVKKLVGVNNDVAQRLIAENCSTVLELAKTDPVWLMMRTNLPLEVVAELIDQAIVWLNFASAKADDTAVKMERLRASNLASATRVEAFVRSMRGTSADAATAQTLCTITAPTLILIPGSPPVSYAPAQLQRIFEAIAQDEATLFLKQLKAIAIDTSPYEAAVPEKTPQVQAA